MCPGRGRTWGQSPGVSGPTLATEGSGELFPVSIVSRSSTTDIAGASSSHPDTAGLMGATLRAPITSSPASDPDGKANVNTGFGPTLVAGSEVQPTQPPHPSLEVEIWFRHSFPVITIFRVLLLLLRTFI